VLPYTSLQASPELGGAGTQKMLETFKATIGRFSEPLAIKSWRDDLQHKPGPKCGTVK
jgi:hypothetical protein